jgi:acetoin utilization protein AcuB
MFVSDIMTKNPVSIDLDQSVEDMRRLLRKFPVHHLLVVDAKRLVGIISDRDLLGALSPFLGTPVERREDVATLRKRVHQIMSRQPFTVTESTAVEECARLMLTRRVSCLPVVRGDLVPVGVVTSHDVLNYVAVGCEECCAKRLNAEKFVGTQAADPWRTLELKGHPSYADAERHFQNLISKYNPDKVADLAPEFSELARQRTRLIVEAWERVQQILHNAA